MVHFTIELIIGFVGIFLIVKILGKTQISQITPFFFISALVLGELLGNAVYEKDVGLLNILYALGLWGFMMIIVEKISDRYLKTRKFLEGSPSIIVRNGIPDRKEMKKTN
ncbi:DUF421 domain-containing protein [Melghirimyces algeriensis]|uniref:YetF-like N-terminal transmembrane domain-containing protein n=1 Tax=Melghirimyces algeriensis TaxID=910412 RepID=A0A521F7N6_9BACL|nr:hypothetical protein SAMN06264849_11327 [Melghirimyces algeriensis]